MTASATTATRNGRSNSVLDQGQIAIRERSHWDVLDLAFRMLRLKARPLALAIVLGIAPLFLLNLWLLSGVWERYSGMSVGGEIVRIPYVYMFWMIGLVVAEVPFATAPVTLILGHVAFARPVRLSTLLRDWRHSLPQLIVYRGLLRPLLISHVFLNEIILLDRNPMRTDDPRVVTTMRRSRALHHGERANLLGLEIATFAVRFVLFFSLWLSLAFLVALFMGDMGSGPIWLVFWSTLLTGEMVTTPVIYTVCFQLALWAVVVLLAVTRFLAYLNLRIRREGWEIELAMRAERGRMVRELS